MLRIQAIPLIFIAIAMAACMPQLNQNKEKSKILKVRNLDDVAGSAEISEEKEIDFHQLITTKCLSCHGPNSSSFEIKSANGKIDLDYLENTLGMIKPGSPSESLIFDSVNSNRMPKGYALSSNEKIAIYNFIFSLNSNSNEDTGQNNQMPPSNQEQENEDPPIDQGSNEQPIGSNAKVFLYNLDNNQIIEITNNTADIVITNKFNIIVEAATNTINQVFYNFDDSDKNQLESLAPYSACGDDGITNLSDCLLEKGLSTNNTYNLSIQTKLNGEIVDSLGPFKLKIALTINEDTNNPSPPPPPPESTGDENPQVASNFSDALPILKANCFSCHSFGDRKFNYETEAEIFNTRFFTPNDPNSHALMRTKGYSGTNPHSFSGSPDMPTNKSFSAEDFAVLKSWITNTTYSNTADNPSDTPDRSPAQLSCDPSVLPATFGGARRLTKAEYQNTLYDLFNQTISALWNKGYGGEVYNYIKDSFDLIPDEDHHKYAASADDITQEHAQAYVLIAIKIANYIENKDHLVTNVIKNSGACNCKSINDTKDGHINKVIETFPKKAFRRNFTSDEVSKFKEELAAFIIEYKKGQNDPDPGDNVELKRQLELKYIKVKVGYIISRVLSSPNFFMHIETEGSNTDEENLYKVSQYELANRLSYYLWQSMPDPILRKAAQEGKLSTPEQLKYHADRMMSDKLYLTNYTKDEITQMSGTERNKAGGYVRSLAYYNIPMKNKVRKMMKTFYSEWLSLNEITTPDINGTPDFTAFANGDSISKKSMLNEIDALTQYYTFDVKGKFNNLLTSEYSFAKDEDLALIYGVEPWDGTSSNLVRLPAGERAGLLNRAALLVSPRVETNPIIRGSRIRQEFLCDKLDPPPPSVLLEAREPIHNPNLTTRERYADLTEGPACIGCHKDINPLGFALEEFDSLGRHRTKENIYDQAGNLLNQLNISAFVTPKVSDGNAATSSNAREFNELIVEDGKAQSCFVKNFYNHAYRKKADTINDSCTLEQLEKNLTASEGSIQSMILEVIMAPAFSLRNTEQ